MRRVWRFNPLLRWTRDSPPPAPVGVVRCALCGVAAREGDRMMQVAPAGGSRYEKATLVTVHAPEDSCRARVRGV